MKRKSVRFNKKDVLASLESVDMVVTLGNGNKVIEVVEDNGVSHFLTEAPDIFDGFVKPGQVNTQHEYESKPLREEANDYEFFTEKEVFIDTFPENIVYAA